MANQARSVPAYGGIINRIMESSRGPEPQVGMGATITHWSDRNAGTVVRVVRTKAGAVKEIHVQGDHAKRIDSNGMSDCQTYEYTPNPEAGVQVFKYLKGKPCRTNGAGLLLGVRDAYHDYSF